MKYKIKRGFASDNYSGAHPEIIRAISNVNIDHAGAYGNDEYTNKAIGKFKDYFGEDIDVHFVYSGTGANVLGLKTVTNSFNAIICSDVAHINVDETGAPEHFTGCKLLIVPTNDGKITVEGIKKYTYRFGDEHYAQPKVISLTQSTEFGTLYTPEEIKIISDFAKNHNMLIHMDGARIANAAIGLNLSFREFTRDIGVDILSFGGTKNGLVFGEAVIFFNKELSSNFKYFRKQGMQLASKMRFISAQFDALLSNELWKRNAKQANSMAKLLELELKKITQVKITQKVEANEIFVIIPKEYISTLQKTYPFYVWDENRSEVRLVTSFDTTESDVHGFIALLIKTIKS